MKSATNLAVLPDALLMGRAGATVRAASALGRGLVLDDFTPAADDAPSTAAAPASPAPPAAPGKAADLYELTKPRMNFLVVVTTLVGYCMAAGAWSDWRLLLHTLLGTALTAAGSGALNQWMERRHDALMPRTASRPLASGRISPLLGLSMGVGLAIAGLIELCLFVNPLTASLGVLTLGAYLFVYTPLKRITSLCTIVGAIPGALPPVMGVAAAAGHVTPIGLLLFGILFLWQMPHFLAIAILYRDDYARGGFKMLPVIDADGMATARQIVIYSLALVPMSLLPTLFGVAGVFYFAAALFMGLAFLGFGVLCALHRTRAAARQLFFASILYLPALLAIMMVDKM